MNCRKALKGCICLSVSTVPSSDNGSAWDSHTSAPKESQLGKSVMPRIPSPSWSGKQGSSNGEIMTGPAQAPSGWVLLPHPLEPEPHNLCAIKTFKSFAPVTSPLKYTLREETDRGKNKPQTKGYLPNLCLPSQETTKQPMTNPTAKQAK